VKVNKDSFKIFYFSTCNERFAFGANNFPILATHTKKKEEKVEMSMIDKEGVLFGVKMGPNGHITRKRQKTFQITIFRQ
jgi:hypothetical protein